MRNLESKSFMPAILARKCRLKFFFDKVLNRRSQWQKLSMFLNVVEEGKDW